MSKHTPGPWVVPIGGSVISITTAEEDQSIATMDHMGDVAEANARLIAAAPELLEALEEGYRAIGWHNAPGDCYATGPITGDQYRDLVECPACSFIAMYNRAIAKAKGETA